MGYEEFSRSSRVLSTEAEGKSSQTNQVQEYHTI